MKTILMQYLKI